MFEIIARKSLAPFVLDCRGTMNARVLGVVGPSGSGKTTLLQCMAGLIVPDEGRIVVRSQVLFDAAARIDRGVTHRGIGYVFQSDLLFPHLSVERNLSYGRYAHGHGPAVNEVIEALELGPLLARRADSLSGGEARRVGLGRALLSGPRLLLLDEPLTGLERRLARRCLAWLSEVVRAFDIPTVYVSHTLSDVLFFCEEVWILSEGRVRAQGPPRRILPAAAFAPEFAESELENIFIAHRTRAVGAAGPAFRVGGQTLLVAEDVPGDHAVLAVRPCDIILAREQPQRISARNVLAGRVGEIQVFDRHALVSVDLGVSWLIRLTRAAVAELELDTGGEVYVIVKASSIEVAPFPCVGGEHRA